MRKRWKVQVLTVLVLFLGEYELNTRRKCTIPLPASWSIILGSRTEACEQKPAFNTPLRQEGYFRCKNMAAKIGKIKIINVFCNDAQKGHPLSTPGKPVPWATSPIWLGEMHELVPVLWNIWANPNTTRQQTHTQVNATWMLLSGRTVPHPQLTWGACSLNAN